MSNATDTPNKQGQRRRRRRGGKNRNNSNNQNQGQSNRSQGGSKSGEGRPRRRRSRSRKPVKLSFWEKLLVTIGLKQDPNKRKSSKPQAGDKASRPHDKASRPPKSNTRNARSRDDGDSPRADSTAKRSKRGSERKGGDPSTVKSNRVYVGNLSYDTTEQDLKELFKGVGNVRTVEIVYNHNTHRSKGYGFVDMMNKEDAIRSVEVLHDQPFMGRNITVSGAKSKGDEEDNEPVMEIKASDVELAPLPQESAVETAEEPDAQPVAEQSVDTSAEETPAEEITAEDESSQEEERKQD